jgi:hypothetical protein
VFVIENKVFVYTTIKFFHCVLLLSEHWLDIVHIEHIIIFLINVTQHLHINNIMRHESPKVTVPSKHSFVQKKGEQKTKSIVDKEIND